MPNVPSGNHGNKIPKWVIGVGVALLLSVVAASAYFILGIGKNLTPAPASTPATSQSNQSTLAAPPTVAPVATAPATLPTSTASASQSALPNSSQTQATSAADLLRQRQQQSGL